MTRNSWRVIFTITIIAVTIFSLTPLGGVFTQQAYSAAPAKPAADQTINDDLIVPFSVCVGQDCSNGESFGFDTIRLKENNLRIKFDDTSSSAAFPSNDWTIVANDSANGGDNYLAFEDSTAGYKPFVVQAGAGSSALFVESGGNVAIGNSDPATKLHVTGGDSPALRLEQSNALGWGEQSWDLVGNESNFFVRDATNGSNTPFRVLSGSDTNMLVVSGANVGVGTASPTSTLHIEGDAYVNGTLIQASDRNLKENIESVDNEVILDQILNTPIYYWNYTADPKDRTHLGPMAQDYHAATSLGTSTTIAPLDVNGALIASVQALHDELESKELQIENLEEENGELLTRLEALEKAVAELLATPAANTE